MTTVFSTTDIPPVAPADIAAVVDAMVRAGRSRVLFHDVTGSDREIVEARFWDAFQGSTEVGVAALVRFWALIDALKSRRLNARLMDKGFAALAPAGAAAAHLRLNVDWGFAPQRLLWAIDAVRVVAPAPARAVRQPAPRLAGASGVALAA
ncbi:MAG: hypothetical protein NW217_06810 [Hyphomicrobiaceae bacterium]|nr:hypothetical protein [Hyphomicrobiaceae bacterium]